MIERRVMFRPVDEQGNLCVSMNGLVRMGRVHTAVISLYLLSPIPIKVTNDCTTNRKLVTYKEDKL